VIPEEDLKTSLDISMTSLGCSPLRLHGVKEFHMGNQEG